MRRLIPAILLAVALVGVGTTPALAKSEPVVACGGISLPRVELPKLGVPNLCDVTGLVKGLAKFAGLTVKATLDLALGLTLSAIDIGLRVTLPHVLGFLLGLPPVVLGIGLALPQVLLGLLCLA